MSLSSENGLPARNLAQVEIISPIQQRVMDWSRLWTLAVGEALPAEPTEAFKDVKPIVEITETIRPREIMISRHPDGSDLMVALLEDTARGAFTLRARIRAADGRKNVLSPVAWTLAERGGAPQALLAILTHLEKTAPGDVTILMFPSGASLEEILEVFAKSGAFDIMKADSDKKEVRRIA